MWVTQYIVQILHIGYSAEANLCEIDADIKSQER